MKLFNEDLIKNLPDYYDKSKTSNVYKFLQLIGYNYGKLKDTSQELDDSLDLEKATGYTLDLYGAMVGQNRGLATDDQYRIMIKTKIERNRCDGSYPGITNCICRILNCKPSEIYLEDSDNDCAVSIEQIPLAAIIGAEFSPSQFTMILKSLMPAGVALESGLYSGTWEFADTENSYAPDNGFTQSEGGNIGGYFGVLSDSSDDAVLPI